MRSKQYFTSIKNNPHEISTAPVLNERAVTIVFLLVFISSKRLFYKPILFKFNQIKGSKNMNHQLHFNLFSILFGFIILQY